MDYESTILNRLIDTYGVVGNPRYISEIIKEFIVRGKERFPNLFTYQSDWLAHIDEFGLNPSYTVSYTGHSIYAPNTLEKPIKSAILTGSTKYRDIDTGDVLDTFDETKNLELVSVKMPVLTTIGNNLMPNDFKLGGLSGTTGTPYEDTFKGSSTNRCFSSLIKVNPSTKISLKIIDPKIEHAIYQFDVNKKRLVGEGWSANLNRTITTKENTEYMCLYIHYTDNADINVSDLHDMIMISKTETITDFIPYKSNILTVNEDVVLCAVGDVKDELDLLTGELTQRTETRAYQEGDESNSEVLTDMTNTRYKLPKEVVKTVDLTILDQNGQNVKQPMSFNGGTHFNTGSLEGSPLPSVSVNVETNLEETLKVCSIEGNTV